MEEITGTKIAVKESIHSHLTIKIVISQDANDLVVNAAN